MELTMATETRFPLYAKGSFFTFKSTVTAASTSSGTAIAYTNATESVRVANDSPQWEIEASVDGGPWVTIGVGGAGNFAVDMSTQTIKLRKSLPAAVDVQVDLQIYTTPTGIYVGDDGGLASVSASGVADSTGLTLTPVHANTGRIPSGSLTYTINGSTGWSVADGMSIWLPSSGTISFAVSGGPTINGATSTLTRTLGSNPIGYVLLNRIQGTSAYSLSGS